MGSKSLREMSPGDPRVGRAIDMRSRVEIDVNGRKGDAGDPILVVIDLPFQFSMTGILGIER
jgi:hypothetical protein